jgi:hypothetical protein
LRRPRRALRRAVEVLAVLAAVAVPHASRAAVEADWFPLRAGAQWVYDTHRDLTLRPEKVALSRFFYAGRSTWIAEPATARAANGFRIRQTTVQAPLGEGGIKTTELEWGVYSFGSELLLHASGGTSEGTNRPEILYDPPLRILPTASVGETWDAGTYREGDRRADLRGKVVGVEDLDGAPAWSGCLKIQLAGAISGALAVSNVDTQIESGRYERLVWFAKGVGIVRQVTTVTAQVKLPDGRRAEIVQVATDRLVEHRPSK